mmetsp:Transcript_25206/g.37115  ORF Transcript_25206/g.37115 Transcript_25206/m.37115 type:complete len:138 (-) Transcript_25206:273-686(-)|eukprot:CAMPEP_0195527014 /NCGR_PEP_ID=MMETSP0794_2-20130614/28420_1 /TAXON_ID=515487 /ORGANISM="Stephanopyxis turris, Strain CCMP 815" /LENGTH=137 /DNA_ID=CAMNT_0040657835 /DNA_START=111 /DNA_END=524 /DNA_ORIENTATION=+
MTRMFNASIIAVVTLASSCGLSYGFVTPMVRSPWAVSKGRVQPLKMSKEQLSEIDAMCVMNTATYCIDGECSLEDVDALINQLEDQRDILSQQLDNLNVFLEDLGVANEPKESERDVDFLKKSMQNIASVFETTKKQ